MKACKFCGTQVTNQEARCPSCGSNVLLNICENCNTQFESGFCPNCGVKAGAAKKVCPECRTVYFSNACPNCGYTPGRKPVVQEIVHKHVYVEPEPKAAPSVTPTQARQTKKKGKGCGCFTWIMKAVEEIVGMPEDLHAFGLFPLGYPAEEREQQDHYDESRIHFIE